MNDDDKEDANALETDAKPSKPKTEDEGKRKGPR